MLEKLLGRRKAYRIKKQALKLPGRIVRSGGSRRVVSKRAAVRRPVASGGVFVELAVVVAALAGICVVVIAKVAVVLGKFAVAIATDMANRVQARQAHKETDVSKFVWEPQVTADGFSCPICRKACSETDGWVACLTCLYATNAASVGNSVSAKPEPVRKALPVATEAEAAEGPQGSGRKPRRTKAQKAESRRGIALVNLARAREVLAAKRAEQANPVTQAPVSAKPSADELLAVRRANMAKAREALAAKRASKLVTVSEAALVVARAACEANNLTREIRDVLAQAGDAMPNGSFPISGPKSLARAIKASHRATSYVTVAKHITARANALGLGAESVVNVPVAAPEPVQAPVSPLMALAAKFRSEVAA